MDEHERNGRSEEVITSYNSLKYWLEKKALKVALRNCKIKGEIEQIKGRWFERIWENVWKVATLIFW